MIGLLIVTQHQARQAVSLARHSLPDRCLADPPLYGAVCLTFVIPSYMHLNFRYITPHQKNETI